jgi:hypothetical protein
MYCVHKSENNRTIKLLASLARMDKPIVRGFDDVQWCSVVLITALDGLVAESLEVETPVAGFPTQSVHITNKDFECVDLHIEKALGWITTGSQDAMDIRGPHDGDIQ